MSKIFLVPLRLMVTKCAEFNEVSRLGLRSGLLMSVIDVEILEAYFF